MVKEEEEEEDMKKKDVLTFFIKIILILNGNCIFNKLDSTCRCCFALNLVFTQYFAERKRISNVHFDFYKYRYLDVYRFEHNDLYKHGFKYRNGNYIIIYLVVYFSTLPRRHLVPIYRCLVHNVTTIPS